MRSNSGEGRRPHARARYGRSRQAHRPRLEAESRSATVAAVPSADRMGVGQRCPTLRSAMAAPQFTFHNLPYGSIKRSAQARPRLCVALGSDAVELAPLADRLEGVPRELIDAPNLDRLLEADAPVWWRLRSALTAALSGGAPELARVPLADAMPCLPFTVGDYVDFYSSLEHATNLGRMFRPDADPLLANWRHLPVGYHGRSATVVVSGTPVSRPLGQRPGSEGLTWGPSRRLDIELEL